MVPFTSMICWDVLLEIKGKYLIILFSIWVSVGEGSCSIGITLGKLEQSMRKHCWKVKFKGLEQLDKIEYLGIHSILQLQSIL